MTERPNSSVAWDLASIGVASGQLLLALWIALFGPSGDLPMHFNIRGEADRWGSRFEAVWILFGMAVLTLGVGPATRFVRPGDDSREAARIRNTTRLIMLATMAPLGLLAGWLGLGSGASGLGQTAYVRVVVLVLWGIIVLVGAVIGKLGPNSVTGVRTYWTRHSRLAWDKANRLLGRIYLVGGLIGLIVGPLLDPDQGAYLLISVTLGGGLIAVFESWRVWRADPERRK